MKPFENFLVDSVGLRRLTDIYLELRQHFQELGWTEDDVKHPPTYTYKLMGLRESFIQEQNALYKQVVDLGFNVDVREFYAFINQIMEKINEITPLKDGDSKRRNKRNKDN
jgi:hypothetical protein